MIKTTRGGRNEWSERLRGCGPRCAHGGTPAIRLGRWAMALALLAHLGGGWSQAAAPERRVALVIGNSAYHIAPLINPVNDANAMAATLTSLGFAVTKLVDASKREMSDAIRRFGDDLKRGGVGLFYFAGHGVELESRHVAHLTENENFLLPVDDDIQSAQHVANKGVNANTVLQTMAKAKNRLNIIILDACRNHPFKRVSRGVAIATQDQPDSRASAEPAGGLAAMKAMVGALIALSAQPGNVAEDGSGQNGVYTSHLLRYLAEPGLKIEDVFKRTRFAVRQETNNRQIPWENTSLEADFYFAPPADGAAADSTAQTADAARRQSQASQSTREGRENSNPTRSHSGFSFSREDAKDQAALAAKDAKAQDVRARLQQPCPDALRSQPIVLDITEASRGEGLIDTDNSAQFARLVHQNLQQAGLHVSLAGAQKRAAAAGKPQGHYAIRGMVFSEQRAHALMRLQDLSVNAELALVEPSGRILTLVEVAEERFAGQSANAAWAFTQEQARDASAQLYTAFCRSSIDKRGRGR